MFSSDKCSEKLLDPAGGNERNQEQNGKTAGKQQRKPKHSTRNHHEPQAPKQSEPSIDKRVSKDGCSLTVPNPQPQRNEEPTQQKTKPVSIRFKTVLS